ncbi:DNA-binding response regulator [Actinoplanes sp. ATCC 53533]|uniref:response regulator n=1 Tax=Actinoplanes sp. ATCC 53533 TaxID=1288362 RepID=UPI000F7A7B9D|nr:response regulator transcription factor [Actinoplanes sp. ATCC 53533]RSM59773.1 DNA-binding response regulator [Actinoplanes sp. ATCC 53533]
MTVRVFVVDDHPLFREGVRAALSGAENLAVVGEATTGEEAIRALSEAEPGVDVVLMDLQLPGISGLEATRSITDTGLTPPRVLMMSMSEDDESVVAAVRAGALGYMVKGAPRDELLLALHTVARGGAVFSPTVAGRLRAYFSAVHEVPGRVVFQVLTDREREVLHLVAAGHNNRRIARGLTLSEKTVRNHISHVFAKLQVKDRAEAIVLARDAGLGQDRDAAPMRPGARRA